MPRPQDIDLEGLEVELQDLEALQTVDPEAVKAELLSQEELFLRLALTPDAPPDLEQRAQAGLIRALETAGARPPAIRVTTVPAIHRDPSPAAKLKLIINNCTPIPAG